MLKKDSNTNNKVNYKIGEVVKLQALPSKGLQSIGEILSKDIPAFLDYLHYIQRVLFAEEVSPSREDLFFFSKDSINQLGRIALEIFRQFRPNVLKMYHIERNDNKPLTIIERTVDEKNLELKITKVDRFAPEAIEQEISGVKIKPTNIIEELIKKNIYTPLIIEKKMFEKIISKYTLNVKHKGELYNYNKEFIKPYPVGTIFYPLKLGEKVFRLYEINFGDESFEKAENFVVQFLRTFNHEIDRVMHASYALVVSKGKETFQQLQKGESLQEFKYVENGIIFMDIFEYSKLSQKIHDPELSEEDNEKIKIKLLNTFHRTVAEVIRHFGPYRVDKIVGDLIMIIILPKEEIKGDYEKASEIAQRTFMICWNIAIALRTINRILDDKFKSHEKNILDDELYKRFKWENRGKDLKIDLISYNPKYISETGEIKVVKSDKGDISITIPMTDLLDYYRTIRQYNIDGGIDVRIGFNVGSALKVFLGGCRIDFTLMGKHVDLAARMESLSKKSVIKFPKHVYKYFSKDFKDFIVDHVVKESGLSSKELTFKMIFTAKRETPKGSDPIASIEFISNLGYFFKTAQEIYQHLTLLFDQHEPNKLHKRVDIYINQNKLMLTEQIRRNNQALRSKTGDEILEMIKTQHTLRNSIEKKVVEQLDNQIIYILNDLRKDNDSFRLVRNLVLNNYRSLYERYFLDNSPMSFHRKRMYFIDNLNKVLDNKLNFDMMTREDIDDFISDFKKKVFGKG